jgi:hypothetical protein
MTADPAKGFFFDNIAEVDPTVGEHAIHVEADQADVPRQRRVDHR